jgi:hypothetical protein
MPEHVDPGDPRIDISDGVETSGALAPSDAGELANADEDTGLPTRRQTCRSEEPRPTSRREHHGGDERVASSASTAVHRVAAAAR